MDLAKGIDALASKINIQNLLQNIDYRVARSKEEIEHCYALVHREYLKRKYTTENRSGLRLSLFGGGLWPAPTGSDGLRHARGQQRRL